jgi:hypothetical protein
MYFSACARQALLAFAPHDGWMSGSSEMPDTMFAGSARDPGQD